MAALTADRKIKFRATGGRRFETYPVAAAVMLWNRALLSVNAAGYIVPAGSTAGLLTVGIGQSRVDNLAGAAGDAEVLIMTGVRVAMVNALAGAAITIAHYHRLVYALDDQTVTNAAGIVAGTCDLIDDDGVWVFVDAAINAAAQRALVT